MTGRLPLQWKGDSFGERLVWTKTRVGEAPVSAEPYGTAPVAPPPENLQIVGRLPDPYRQARRQHEGVPRGQPMFRMPFDVKHHGPGAQEPEQDVRVVPGRRDLDSGDAPRHLNPGYSLGRGSDSGLPGLETRNPPRLPGDVRRPVEDELRALELAVGTEGRVGSSISWSTLVRCSAGTPISITWTLRRPRGPGGGSPGAGSGNSRRRARTAVPGPRRRPAPIRGGRR